MLSIHYVSVMMCIFYINCQHYWKWDWILNIGANAHGKQTTSTKQPQHKWQTWQSRFPVTSETCIELVWVTKLFHSATVSHCDRFWILHVFVVWNFTIFLRGGRGGGLRSSVFTTWWHILISRPPRVFRRFKRRSCTLMILFLIMDIICLQSIDGGHARVVFIQIAKWSQGPHNGACGIRIYVLFEMLSLLCLF